MRKYLIIEVAQTHFYSYMIKNTIPHDYFGNPKSVRSFVLQ
jgi:hypothetical protein